ncbi:hypothetical protein ABT158_25465 [Nonomuraea sp. NPDC001636]
MHTRSGRIPLVLWITPSERLYGRSWTPLRSDFEEPHDPRTPLALPQVVR